jgi:hypothetical protein
MIAFACPECSRHLEVPNLAAGKEFSCPGCNQRVQIPGTPRHTLRGVPDPPTIDVEPVPVAPVIPTLCPVACSSNLRGVLVAVGAVVAGLAIIVGMPIMLPQNPLFIGALALAGMFVLSASAFGVSLVINVGFLTRLWRFLGRD